MATEKKTTAQKAATKKATAKKPVAKKAAKAVVKHIGLVKNDPYLRLPVDGCSVSGHLMLQTSI